MSINEVIESGKNIVKPEFGLFSQFTDTTWGWVIAAIAIALIFMVLAYRSDNPLSYAIHFTFSMVAGMVVAYAIFIRVFVDVDIAENDAYEANVEKWRNEVAIPYIESLQTEKKEIVFIKIEPETSSYRNSYTHSSVIERTPITVSYKDNGVVTRTSWFETYMELTDDEKPYIEFQRLTQDLGHDVKAGVYNSKIYLPESYEFTDIK